MPKFYDLPIHRKVMKRNPMKQKSNDLDLRPRKNPCFKIKKIMHSNLGEMKNNLISRMKLPS